MPKFIATELVDNVQLIIETWRLGAGTGAANALTDADRSKAVKVVAESRMNLCAVGDEIEGFISSIDVATSDGFTTGGVQRNRRMTVTFDGLQATPGTGVLAVGDFVVAGRPVAKNVALTVPVAVCKATAAPKDLTYRWRVISLGAAGTGAVGTVGLIEAI